MPNELLARVQTIKQSVRDAIGDAPSYELRSSQTYQAYTGLCGEVAMAIEDDALDAALVEMLDEQAQQVLSMLRAQPAA